MDRKRSCYGLLSCVILEGLRKATVKISQNGLCSVTIESYIALVNR